MSKIVRIMKNAAVILTSQECSTQSQTSETEFQTIKDYLVRIRPEISMLNLDEYKYKMIYSGMQSGKTSMIICKAIEQALSGYNVIIVVRNYCMDLMQIKRRLNDTLSIIEMKLKNGEIKSGLCEVEVVTTEDVRMLDLYKNSNSGKIILMMGSDSEYNKINDFYKIAEQDRIRQTIMMIDEVDINVKKERSNMGKKLLENEHWNIIQRVGVTATAAGFLLSDSLFNSSQLVMLTPSKDYKGIGKIDITKIKEDESDMLNVYDNIAWTEHKYETSTGSAHPYIILNKTGREKNQHETLAWKLYERYHDDKIGGKTNKNNWIHIIVNGNGIKVLCDTLLYKVKETEKTINGKIIKTFTKELGKEYKEVDGCYIIKEDISSVLQIIKINLELGIKNTKKNIQNTVINIVGGMCFSRGISVVSRDYQWHINSEYYIPGKTTDCGSILQALRVCGVFVDSIPLKLYTTENVQGHIEGYNSLQNKIMECLNANVGCSITDALDMIIVSEEELRLKRGLGRGKDGRDVKIKYTVVKDSKIWLAGKGEDIQETIKELKATPLGNHMYQTKGKVTKISRKL